MHQNGSILFVDSDPNQLESLQRNLREQRERWRLLFTNDADSALALMQEQPVDILVSETRLTGSTGSALLKRAQERHPLTTRLLFSAQTVREPAQEMVHHAHQFVAKSTSNEELVSTLERILQLRELLQNPAMREMIHNLGTLPSLPETYFRMIEALRSEFTTVQQIGKLVEQDLAMSAKVLQLVNSAFFGLRQHIASPVHAVSLLGIETVTNLALTAGLFSQLKQSLVETFQLQALWHHSMNVAGLTRVLCTELGLDREKSEVPVLAGMLHDLGKLVLATSDTEEYRRVFDLTRQQNLPLHLVEAESLWADHAAVGAYLMGLWGLPLQAVEAVALHHKPDLQQREQVYCLVVYAANLLLHLHTDKEQSIYYTTDRLQALVGKEDAERWSTIAREYLDGKTA